MKCISMLHRAKEHGRCRLPDASRPPRQQRLRRHSLRPRLDTSPRQTHAVIVFKHTNIKQTGHSTHCTTLDHTPAHVASRSVTRVSFIQSGNTQTSAAHEGWQQTNRWRGGTPASPGTQPPRPPFAYRCNTYFLHLNFSSTIFMFEEYLSESETYFRMEQHIIYLLIGIC